jgi:hypothetical protein
MRDDELIDMVKVLEIQPNNNVYLEFWCRENSTSHIISERYVVFGFSEKENPKWICEGDLGRGYKE